MSYWQEHSIAGGFDNTAGYANLETYFAAPFAGDRVPEGSVVDDAVSGHRRVGGFRRVFLRTDACAWSELDAYVTAVFGGWDGAMDEEVTTRQRKQDNTYADFNALAFKPVEGTHFQRGATIDDVSGVELEYLILEEIPPEEP